MLLINLSDYRYVGISMFSLRGQRRWRSTLLINLLLFSPFALSANQWGGEVTMNGRINASACAIDTESIDQTITIATLPINQIMRDGQSELRTFNIKLVNCALEKFNPELDDWRYFSVTFEGREDAGLFGVDGQAKGIALQISDNLGNIAIPGIPMVNSELQSGTMEFNYGVRLVGNSQVVKLGGYYSTVRFHMDYY